MASGGNYELLCLENPLLDIQATGDEALLQKYGLKANDAILAEEKHMGIYEDLLSRKAKLIAGGAAQNTARGAQYILPPDSVVYIGCVGRDKFAETLESAAKDVGLKVVYRYDETQPTGRCGVVITGHDRSMCTDLAAANCYKIDHLKSPEVWKYAEAAKVFYVGGFHLTVSPPAILALAEEAAAKDKIFMLSLSAPFIPEFFKDPLDQTAPYWDYVVGNETEALAYAKSHGLSTTSIPEIASHLASLPKKNTKRSRIAIITQGTDPTIVATTDASGGKPTLKEFPVHAISKSEITDTNGAGDAFAGGFVAGITQGKPLETCIDMGHWLASLSIRELGPSYPFPKKTYAS
ncbi:Ribokinase-like protein [Viridothelium virens]|uniref:Adenosine kinase n=1 Tax=Viridothelium virens TaxID=1048519 RepID=A0A6A6GW10_VIRVR|nr:Ribokinase-like protein [Viridothelium virens]